MGIGMHAGGRKVAKRLKRLVRDGHLNDGYCRELRDSIIAGPGPFSGKRQTTIGGAEAGDTMDESLIHHLNFHNLSIILGCVTVCEVSAVLRSLEQSEKALRLCAIVRSSKADWGRLIGRMLREVRDDGNAPAPPGVAPVNWEMQLACCRLERSNEIDMKLRNHTEANGDVWNQTC